MKNIKIISLMTLILLSAACAHHPDVRPGADGVHRVVLAADFKEATDEGRDAMKQADEYCKESGKKAAVVEENCKYTGSMKEDDYIAAKKAARIANAVGDVISGIGYGKHAETGESVKDSGRGADDAIGKGYTYEMKFKCQ